MKKTKNLTIKNYTNVPTSDKNLFRVVDRNGDWTHYFLKKQKRYIPAVNHVISTGFPKGERFMKYLLNTTKEQAEKKLNTAGEEGTRTHQAIRDLIDGARIHLSSKYRNENGKMEILNNEEWDNLIAFTEWWKKYEPKLIMHEFSIAHEQYGYAGTPDFVGTIVIPEGDKCAPKEVWGKRVLVLLDWKTSSGIWDEYKLQTAAYLEAILNKNAGKLGFGDYEYGFTGVVRVGTAHKCGYEMELWNPLDTKLHFDLFLKAYANYKFITGEDEEFSPKVRELPTEFKLIVKKEIKTKK